MDIDVDIDIDTDEGADVNGEDADICVLGVGYLPHSTP